MLDLLNTIFNQAMISEEDFANIEKRSGALVTLKLDEDEIGITGLDIDPMTGNTITICALLTTRILELNLRSKGAEKVFHPL